jgi:hypothetical protein
MAPPIFAHAVASYRTGGLPSRGSGPGTLEAASFNATMSALGQKQKLLTVISMSGLVFFPDIPCFAILRREH